ncbi:serine/threonine protein kinase [Coemansia sp. RSA 2049]|nr:serine/threonine protein kinase [Coemansia sp. RSA 2049]KAJ2512203.1 serine/threonine protein kinase [Coemansia sp. RSA 1939]KAJ2689868.1 serine/threonine protein kinase [Coemansia sp. RSA 1285]
MSPGRDNHHQQQQQLTGSQEMDCLNQLFQEQLLVNQVPRSVWGVLLSLSPADYKTVLLERTKSAATPTISDNGSLAGQVSSPQAAATKFGYYIGRHKSCDIRVQNPHISNRHCLIYRVEAECASSSSNNSSGDCVGRGSGVYLEDTSTNGTYVNGARVGKSNSVELRDGDEIQFVRYQPEKGMAYFNDRFYVFQDLEVHRREPCLFKQSYYLSEQLGKGAFAQVRMAINRVTGERFAAKIIDRNRITQLEKRKKMDENFQVETSILSRVRHPSIVQVHGVFRESDYLYLVLDLAADGELFDEIVRREYLAEDDARRVLLQLLLAIRHLNRLGIVHRDIKLENILLEDKQSLRIKLADFGLAKIVGEQMFMKTVCGTPMYVAPEVLTVRQLGMYDRLVDVWSLGVVLYICLCGFPPFSDELSPPPMRDQIIGGMYSFPSPYWDGVSPQAIDLVCRMLQADPRNRITVDDALAHPWLRARRCGSSWSIDGQDFLVADPDAMLDDSQRTQSLTAESSQLNSPCPPQLTLQPTTPYLPMTPARLPTRLPPSSPPAAPAVLLQDSEIAFDAHVSASDSEAHLSIGGSSSTRGMLAIAAANAKLNRDTLDGANFMASGNEDGAGRKRKDPSFMRSQSDLGHMVLPRRKVGIDLAQDDEEGVDVEEDPLAWRRSEAPAQHRSPPAAAGQFCLNFHSRNHISPPSAQQQVSPSGPVPLFDMSPDASRHPSVSNAKDANYGGDGASDNSSGSVRAVKDRFGTVRDRHGARFGCPLSIYPEAIPRPGTTATPNPGGLKDGVSDNPLLGKKRPNNRQQYYHHTPNVFR